MELKNYYLISGSYVIFAFIYLIFAIFSFIRLKDVFELRGLYKISIFFYFSVTFICFLRIFDFIFIALLVPGLITYGNENTIVITGLIYFTDPFFWIVFIILIFRLIQIFYEGHISEENTPFMRIIKPISTNLIILIIFLNLLIEIILTTLLSFEVLSSSNYILQIAILNIILPSILIFIEIYLHLKYSGAPYISILASDNKGILNKSVIVWGLGRAYHGCWSMYLSQKNMYEILNKSEKEIEDNFELILVNMSLIIVDVILTELLPLLVCYDINFAKAIFSMHNSNENLLEKNDKNIKNKAEEYNIEILSNLIISYSEVKFPDLKENLNLKKKNGFGNLCLSTYENINYLGRIITLKGFTPYVMEEFYSDLLKQQEISKIKNINFRPVKYYCIYNTNTEKSLLYLCDYYPNGSIRNLLNKPGTSLKLKIRIALDIAKCIDGMHRLQPPLIHGHLNINNIILDNEFKILIDDAFFITLKKYYTLNSNYCYKTAYTAPEFLLETNRFIFKPTIEGDIYSLGIIFYEIFTENKPFNGLSLKELIKKVSVEKIRPKIQDNILNSKLVNLIRCCWQDEPLKRPNSIQVVQVLNDLLG